jgi:hypothetical protein
LVGRRTALELSPACSSSSPDGPVRFPPVSVLIRSISRPAACAAAKVS